MTQPESMGETIREDVLATARDVLRRTDAERGDYDAEVEVIARAILAERERVRAILAHDAPWSPRRYIYDKTPERRIAALDKMDEAIG